jgi:hypothetical protein
MKDPLFKKNITMHIKRREFKKDETDIISNKPSTNDCEVNKKDYFQDENSDDFLHKYYRIHSKDFSFFELYNNISELLFSLRIYIILVFICVIFAILYY